MSCGSFLFFCLFCFCYLQGQGHSEGSYNQNMTLLYFDSLATKLDLMIHRHKPECPVKKKRITAFRVKVTAKGKNVNVCPDNVF